MFQIAGIGFSQEEPADTYEFQPDNPESNIISLLEQIQSSFLIEKSTNKIILPSYSQQDVISSMIDIRNYLENDYDAQLYIRSNNGFQIFSSLLQATDNSTIIDHTIQSLRILSQNFSSDLSDILDYKRIVELIKGETDIITKKCSLSLLSNISSRNPNMTIMNEILQLHDYKDTSIRINVINIVTNIFETMNQEIQPEFSIQFVTQQLFSVPQKIRDKCLSSLSKITVNPENTSMIICSNIDFNKLLHIQNQTQENQKQILSLILSLLPQSKKLEPLGHPKNKRPKISYEFACRIQPVLANFIVERPISPHLSLLAFAASMTSNSIEFEVSDLLISNLLSYSTNQNLAPYVLAGFSFLFDINKQNSKKTEIENKIEFIESKTSSLIQQNHFSQSNFIYNQNELNNKPLRTDSKNEFFIKNQMINYAEIVQVLESADVNPQIQKWYNEGIRILKSLSNEKRINFEKLSMKEIIEKIENHQISPIEFIYGQGADRVLQLLKEEIDKNNLNSTQEIKILSEFATENLTIFPLSCNYGSNSIIEFLNVLQSNGTLQVVLPSQKTIQINAPLQSPISLVEGLINSEMDEYNSTTIKNLIEEQPELQKMLNLSYPLQASQLSLLSRAIDSSYPALKLTSNDKSYTVHDSWFSIFCDNEKKKNPLICEEDENSQEEKTIAPKFKNLKLFFFSSLFEILSILYMKFDYKATCHEFIEKVRFSLSYPFNSIGRLSPNLTLIFAFPFLFPTDLKALAFKLIAFDPLSSLRELINEFGNYDGDISLFPKQSPLKIYVSRDHVFEDGIKYLKLFAQNKIPVEVQFEGEPATGPGPTKEFFSLLSDEFKKRNIFRFDENQGLFPSPDADPEIFEFLGILIAKSLSMNCMTNFQFNPAFFEKLRGKNVSLDQIDQVMDENLQKDLTGIEFEYPGHPNIDLTADENDVHYSDDSFRNILNKIKLISKAKKEIHHDEGEIIEQLSFYKEKTKDFDQLFDMCQLQMQLFENKGIGIQRKSGKKSQKDFTFKFPQATSQKQQIYKIQNNSQNSKLNCFDGVFVSLDLDKQQKQKITVLNNSFMKIQKQQIEIQKLYDSQNQKSFIFNENDPLEIQNNQTSSYQKLKQPNQINNVKNDFQNSNINKIIVHQQKDIFDDKLLTNQFEYQQDNPRYKLIQKQQNQQFFYDKDNPHHIVIPKQPAEQFSYQEDNPNKQLIQQKPSRKFIHDEDNPHHIIIQKPPAEQFSYQEDNPDQQLIQQKPSRQFIHDEDNPHRIIIQKPPAEQSSYQENNPDQQLIQQKPSQQFIYDEDNPQQKLNQPIQQSTYQEDNPENQSIQNASEENQSQQPFNDEENENQQQQFNEEEENENQSQQPFNDEENENQQKQQFNDEEENENQQKQPFIDKENENQSQQQFNDEEENENQQRPSILITPDNQEEFCRLVREKSVGTNVDRCCAFFKKGFNSVIPFELTNLFTSDELSYYIGGETDLITYDDLVQNVDLDGFTQEDQQIIDFFNTISELEQSDQQKFLQFVTASRNLPLGGLKSLSPHLKITRVDYKEINIDSAYPTVSTCTHLLKLPPFSSKEIQEKYLLTALERSTQSFQLG